MSPTHPNGFVLLQVVPCVIDVGTNNLALRRDPFYCGLDMPRLTGKAYYEVVDEVSTEQEEGGGRGGTVHSVESVILRQAHVLHLGALVPSCSLAAKCAPTLCCCVLSSACVRVCACAASLCMQ